MSEATLTATDNSNGTATVSGTGFKSNAGVAVTFKDRENIGQVFKASTGPGGIFVVECEPVGGNGQYQVRAADSQGHSASATVTITGASDPLGD